MRVEDDEAGRKTRVRAIFRAVNERIREVGDENATDAPLELVCECGSSNCTETIAVPIEMYDVVRAMRGIHIVMAGHDDDAVVHEDHGSWSVVEPTSGSRTDDS